MNLVDYFVEFLSRHLVAFVRISAEHTFAIITQPRRIIQLYESNIKRFVSNKKVLPYCSVDYRGRCISRNLEKNWTDWSQTQIILSLNCWKCLMSKYKSLTRQTYVKLSFVGFPTWWTFIAMISDATLPAKATPRRTANNASSPAIGKNHKWF